MPMEVSTTPTLCLLAQDNDSNYLSEKHCFGRSKFVELILLSAAQANSIRNGARKQAAPNQVAVRCAGCKRAYKIVWSIALQKGYVDSLIKEHCLKCHKVQQELKDQFKSLNAQPPKKKRMSSGDYWIYSAKQIGLYQGDGGVFFRKPHDDDVMKSRDCLKEPQEDGSPRPYRKRKEPPIIHPANRQRQPHPNSSTHSYPYSIPPIDAYPYQQPAYHPHATPHPASSNQNAYHHSMYLNTSYPSPHHYHQNITSTRSYANQNSYIMERSLPPSSGSSKMQRSSIAGGDGMASTQPRNVYPPSLYDNGHYPPLSSSIDPTSPSQFLSFIAGRRISEDNDVIKATLKDLIKNDMIRWKRKHKPNDIDSEDEEAVTEAGEKAQETEKSDSEVNRTVEEAVRSQCADANKSVTKTREEWTVEEDKDRGEKNEKLLKQAYEEGTDSLVEYASGNSRLGNSTVFGKQNDDIGATIAKIDCKANVTVSNSPVVDGMIATLPSDNIPFHTLNMDSAVDTAANFSDGTFDMNSSLEVEGESGEKKVAEKVNNKRADSSGVCNYTQADNFAPSRFPSIPLDCFDGPDASITPNENDVLFGHAANINSHPGNLRLQRIIQESKPKFLSTGCIRSVATDIAMEIIQQGGLFLSELNDTHKSSPSWVSVDARGAITKVEGLLTRLKDRSDKSMKASVPARNNGTVDFQNACAVEAEKLIDSINLLPPTLPNASEKPAMATMPIHNNGNSNNINISSSSSKMPGIFQRNTANVADNNSGLNCLAEASSWHLNTSSLSQQLLHSQQQQMALTNYNAQQMYSMLHPYNAPLSTPFQLSCMTQRLDQQIAAGFATFQQHRMSSNLPPAM